MAAGMAKHVGVRLQSEAKTTAGRTLDHLREARGRKRRTARSNASLDAYSPKYLSTIWIPSSYIFWYSDWNCSPRFVSSWIGKDHELDKGPRPRPRTNRPFPSARPQRMIPKTNRKRGNTMKNVALLGLFVLAG
jgi:hypothetical protein